MNDQHRGDTHDSRTARLQANVEKVRTRVVVACERAGRPVDEVRIIAVTKYVDAADTARILDCGILDLGESRPQLLWEKAAALAGQAAGIRWHMIGHLQRNKVHRTLPLVSLLHSLDSNRLAATIAEEAAQREAPCRALIEVNLTADPQRSGIRLEELDAFAEKVAGIRWIQVAGLMGMAGKPDDPRASPRRQFAELRGARDRLQRLFDGPGELSMGMSSDFEEAILEGATMVRIGSVLWEGLRLEA